MDEAAATFVRPRQYAITWGRKTLITFAERFRRALELSGLSLAKVGENVGVTTQAAWNYEKRHEEGLSVEVLFLLADVLGVSVRWLETGDGAMKDSDTSS